MKCPMKFNNPCYDEDDECCGFDCMWYQRISVDKDNTFGCAVAMNGIASALAGERVACINFGYPSVDGWEDRNNKEGN